MVPSNGARAAMLPQEQAGVQIIQMVAGAKHGTHMRMRSRVSTMMRCLNDAVHRSGYHHELVPWR